LLLVVPQLVEIRQQLVAQAHMVANGLQSLVAKHPGLLLGGAGASVVAHEGKQAARLVPGNCQFLVRVAAKPGTSGPLNGMPDSARFRLQWMLVRRWCQLLKLSPVHTAVKRLEPV
jgi:hypothetical protein